MATGDLKRMNTYGVVKRDGQDDIVLIDFGANKDIINKFYTR